MKTSNETTKIMKALFDVHKEIPIIKHNKYNDYGGYGYTSLDEIFKIVKPILFKNDLFCLQTIGESDNGVLITTRIQHLSSEFVEDSFSLPAVENKKMSIAQEMGTSISYGKRYGISAILGIVTDEDTDARKVKKQANNYTNGLDYNVVNKELSECKTGEEIDNYSKILMKEYPNMTEKQKSIVAPKFANRRLEIKL